MRTATAIANANIALAKYWGKRAYAGNYPAVPSLSVTLAGLQTTTTVSFERSLSVDELMLNGVAQEGKELDRVAALLDRIRAVMLSPCFARVVSANGFPTASGLASSASGFAALAAASTRAAGLDVELDAVSDLARRSSASAARSVFGGFVSLDAGPIAVSNERLAAKMFAPADALDMHVLVCVVTEAAKTIGSTEAMRRTAKESSLYDAWLAVAPVQYASICDSLNRADFEALGRAAEASALTMHASAFAARIVYGTQSTFALLQSVRRLRDSGTLVFATMDAGPHVKVLVQSPNVAGVREQLVKSGHVLRVIDAQPCAQGVRFVDEDTR